MDTAGLTDQIGNVAALGWAWAAEFLPRLGGALLIAVIGFTVAGRISKLIRGGPATTRHLDATLRPVLALVARYTIIIIVAVAALSQLGVQTASILAALGAAGLAIGLALQGTLSNLAAGIMLLWLRPFRVGDFVECPTAAGTVEELSLFNTRLTTWDGIYKFVPNSNLWNTVLTNYTRNPTRLILIEFGIDYGDDLAVARRILSQHAAAHPKVLKEPAIQVVPLSLADSAIVLQLRAWTTTADFWDVRWDLTQGGKQALQAAGLTIPFPQQVVHVVGSEEAARAGLA